MIFSRSNDFTGTRRIVVLITLPEGGNPSPAFFKASIIVVTVF